MRARKLTQNQMGVLYAFAEDLKRKAEELAVLKGADEVDLVAETSYVRDLVIEARFAMNNLWLHECKITVTKSKEKSKSEKTKAKQKKSE